MSQAAVITGGASGIGLACAHALAGDGWPVLIADINGDSAEVAAGQLPDAVGVQLDVTDPAACERAVQVAVDRWGGVGALVTAAGIVRGGPAHEHTTDDFVSVLNVNVCGTFFAARAAGRAMIDGGVGGRIVLVGSILSAVGLPGRAAYGSSKGAVMQLGKVLALDWAEYGINVNVLGPGITATPMSDRQLADPAVRDHLLGTIPMGRMASVEEIASVAAFLCAPGASYMTGAFVPVDGGFVAGGGKQRAGSAR